MTGPAAAPASSPAGPRRLAVLCAIAVTGAVLLGLYLFGPIWPGALGRLQLATREGWGWAGPADLEVTAEPATAWIELRRDGDPSPIEGRGRIRAKIGAGTYHCRVGCNGYTTQAFQLWCPPDARTTRHVTLEPAR